MVEHLTVPFTACICASSSENPFMTILILNIKAIIDSSILKDADSLSVILYFTCLLV